MMPELMARAMVHLAGPVDFMLLYLAQISGVQNFAPRHGFPEAIAASIFSLGYLNDGDHTKVWGLGKDATLVGIVGRL